MNTDSRMLVLVNKKIDKSNMLELVEASQEYPKDDNFLILATTVGGQATHTFFHEEQNKKVGEETDSHIIPIELNSWTNYINLVTGINNMNNFIMASMIKDYLFLKGTSFTTILNAIKSYDSVDSTELFNEIVTITEYKELDSLVRDTLEKGQVNLFLLTY